MAALIIIINLVIGSLFGGGHSKVIIKNGNTATLSGTSSDGRNKTISIIIQKNNPIILEGEY